MAAEQPASTAIREAVAARLGEIKRANGYRTDVGVDVRTEPSRFEDSDGPRITVWPVGRARPDHARSVGERAVQVLIEVLVPVCADTPLEDLEAADQDIEDALNEYLQLPGALPLRFEESVILDRPEGVPAMAAQIIYSGGYRR
jgi:hypothetical protein